MSARTPVLNQHWPLSGFTGRNELVVCSERLGDMLQVRPKDLNFLAIFLSTENREE